MNTEILRRRNLKIREARPLIPRDKVCDIFCDDTLIEVCFLSNQCRNDLRGACIMCNYGATRDTRSPQEYLSCLSRALEDVTPTVHTILLSTNGSFLDERQIPEDLLNSILCYVGKSAMQKVEIETHYADVSEQKLKKIKEMLPEKELLLEFGLETANHEYHKSLFMKGVNLNALDQTIQCAHALGIKVECNIMIGLPFISEKQQFDDALSSIQWTFAHGCAPVLFPVNIKPHTLLMDIYRAGYYKPVSQWMIPLLLAELTAEQLGQVTVAWFGNREDIYDDNERTIFPVACEHCNTAIYHFYQQFLIAEDGVKRKELLARLFSDVPCTCAKQVQHAIDLGGTYTFEDRLTAYVQHITRRKTRQEEVCP